MPKLLVKCEVKGNVNDKAEEVIGYDLAEVGLERAIVAEATSVMNEVARGSSRKQPTKKTARAALKRAIKVMKK